MKRRTFVKMLSCACSADEARVMEDMKSRCTVASDANLARIALWSLADDLGIDMPSGVFDLRLWERVDFTAPAPDVAPLVKKARMYARPKPPSANHPWRGQRKRVPPIKEAA